RRLHRARGTCAATGNAGRHRPGAVRRFGASSRFHGQAVPSHHSNKIRFEIETASVRRLDYTGHRHANEGAATAGFVAGGFIGMFAGSPVRSTDHYLELEYMLPDG